MIRTRNFLLFILTLAFLVGGILLTLWFSADTSGQNRYADMIFGGADTATMTAEVLTPEDKRQSRLDSLRAKLAEYTDVALAPNETDLPESIETEVDTVATTTDSAVASVDLCTNYKAVSVPALSGLLTYSESSGQRIFGIQTVIPATSSTTPETVTMTPVFTLPLRTAALGSNSCVGSSVVAVTPTGVPILNTDVVKYSGAGEATLIGYTIDGFELYGNSNSLATDACGGTTVFGTYRYYLSSDRPTILNCFVAIPVAL
jgi:hypothetical protein